MLGRWMLLMLALAASLGAGLRLEIRVGLLGAADPGGCGTECCCAPEEPLELGCCVPEQVPRSHLSIESTCGCGGHGDDVLCFVGPDTRFPLRAGERDEPLERPWPDPLAPLDPASLRISPEAPPPRAVGSPVA